jgi:hypothetical protein
MSLVIEGKTYPVGKGRLRFFEEAIRMTGSETEAILLLAAQVTGRPVDEFDSVDLEDVSLAGEA